MPDINLLQSNLEEGGVNSSAFTRTVAKLLMFLVLVVIVAYVAMLFDTWNTNRKLAETNEKTQNLQAAAINNTDRDELVTRQEQLNELGTLIEDHVYWSYLLPELGRITLKTAKYTEIDANRSGELTLVANLPSYDDIDKFMQIFDLPEYNEEFSNVRVVSIGKVQNGDKIETELRVQLTFNPEFIKGRM
jgi:hypothetical protein